MSCMSCMRDWLHYILLMTALFSSLSRLRAVGDLFSQTNSPGSPMYLPEDWPGTTPGGT